MRAAAARPEHLGAHVAMASVTLNGIDGKEWC